jgi:hypothetical protein
MTVRAYVPIWLNPALASDVDALARRIVGKSAGANVLESARRIAEAQIDLRRVRCHRNRLIERAMPDPKVQAKAAEPAPFEQAAAVGADDPTGSWTRPARGETVGPCSRVRQEPRGA